MLCSSRLQEFVAQVFQGFGVQELGPGIVFVGLLAGSWVVISKVYK